MFLRCVNNMTVVSCKASEFIIICTIADVFGIVRVAHFGKYSRENKERVVQCS